MGQTMEENNLIKIYEHLALSDEALSFRYVDDGEVHEISDKRFYTDINKCIAFINGLKNEGYKNLGILSENSYEFYTFFIAALLTKTMVTMMNYMEDLEKIREYIEISGADYLLYGKAVSQRIIDAVSIKGSSLIIPDCTEGICDSFEEDDLFKPAMIFFTSGTTGVPKAVLLSVNNVFSCSIISLISEVDSVSENERKTLLLALPAYHVAGIGAFVSGILNNVIIHISQMRDLYGELRLMPSVYCATIPAVLKLWQTALIRKKPEKLGGIKYIYSGAACLDGVNVDVYKEYGIKIRQLYGMTETAGRGAENLSDDFFAQGMQELKTQIKISDSGEILIKSVGNMIGYLNDSKATEEIYEDGWIHTGDIGDIDEKGLLRIKGRIKNLIILSSGENVSPEEIESKLSLNKDIIECLVYAQNDKICADIVCVPGKENEIQQYIVALNKKMPSYKKIIKTYFVDHPIGKNMMGKVQRKK